MTPPTALRRRRAQRIAWAAPLLVGASAAIAAEVATGILLYAGPGLMRSLTTVLAVEGTALAVGLWSAPRSGGPPTIDRLRRRWLFCLLAFMAAALFGTSWSVVQDLGGGAMSQGIGLAVLGALPLYACGLVLGGMGAVSVDLSGGLPAPGAAAALGAAVGFVLTGALLPRAPIPASLLVACLVLLSAGGMIYGVALASRPVVHVLAERRAAGGDVRVEDHLRIEDEAARYLLENGHVRRRSTSNGERGPPWEVELARSLLGRAEGLERVLAVGSGASAFPPILVSERPAATVDVLERNAAVVDLAHSHFEGTAIDEDPTDRVTVRTGNLDDLVADVRGPYDLVLVDTSGLAALGGVGGLSRSARAALLSAVGSTGSVVVGPAAPEPDALGAPDGWRAVTLCRTGETVADERVVIVQPAGARAWSGAIAGFEQRIGDRSEP